MDDVVPLKTMPTTDSKAPRTVTKKRDVDVFPIAIKHTFSSSGAEHMQIDPDDSSDHRKNGVQKRILQKLKRGHFPVVEQLDLHSMTTRTAQTALLEFVAGAQSDAPACIRIIHGKGTRSEHGPRLRVMTRHILRDHPQVLAFTACKPAEGGTGAMDVLLKSL